MRRLCFSRDDVSNGYLILVNQSHPLSKDIPKESLISAFPDAPNILLERKGAAMLSEALACLNCEKKIVPVSGYRTMTEQKNIYRDSLREHGKHFTRKFVAVPGCSEHQSGLAIDLAENRDKIDFICPAFPYDGICGSFRALAARYGFIERYPAGREKITGIAHEPWHFRYVGYPHSKIMKEKRLTLEEYTEYLKSYPYRGKHLHFQSDFLIFEIFYVPVNGENQAEAEIPERMPYQVSGNNSGGVTVTLWGKAI